MDLDKPFYTVDEAAKVMGYHPQSIYRMIRQETEVGQLFSKGMTNRHRISRENLLKALGNE